MSKNYFEIKYRGPYKGVDVSMPEDLIPLDASPSMINMILKNGEIRTRPQLLVNQIPGTPDKQPIIIITSFIDANNVFHTVAVTNTGLWQLNANWYRSPVTPSKTWQSIGKYTEPPGPNIPVSSSVFINKFFWTNGGSNLFVWDGITSVGAPATWKADTAYIQGSQILDSNGNVEVAQNSGISGSSVPTWSGSLAGTTTDGTGNSQITWTMGGKPASANGFASVAVVNATTGITAGAYFLIELNAQLIMLNTVEDGQNFPQRVRWSPSGLPTIWDPDVNIGAGFNDLLDVPDAITGALTVGTTAFILRNNGVTEVTSTGQGINPFDFDHLWASDRGIGNIYPFGYASYGPLGIIISSDDIYNISLGGFKRIGGRARDAIYNDLFSTTGVPIGAIIPYYSGKYVYNHYRLSIPQGSNNKTWVYSIEDDNWSPEYHTNKYFTGITRWNFVS
jgi:hypothetical protein